jgi:hypothetical protein
MLDRIAFGLAVLAAVSVPPLPQAVEGPDAPASAYFELQDRLAAWRAQHGPAWRAEYEPETGFASTLWGGSAVAPFLPRDEDDCIRLAQAAVERTRALHGVDPGTLVPDRAVFLPLGLAGSSDKWTVRLRQEVQGLPVPGGSVNVLLDTTGRLLSVDAVALTGDLSGFSTLPAVSAGDALEWASGTFGSETGLPPTRVVGPELVVVPYLDGKHRTARLAWEVSIFHEAAGSPPAGWLYRVDAVRGGILESRRALHHFDVSGQVRSLATPGAAPDTPSNPETSQPMPYVRVSSAQGSAVTDVDGSFTIPGASAPLSVTLVYEGPFAATDNQAGSDYSLTTTLGSATGNVVTMNPAASAAVTAEANAFNWIGLMREWTRVVNPADATSDFLAAANVNISSTCNAYYNGVSVNFYAAGGSCVNTAYSSVVLHEMGHWLNDLYGSGNGADGFGEGNADAFSMYILDDPVVGEDFCGTGCDIRTGENTRQFCGDCCGGCYGQVHADGEVLGGALWKVRARLKAALGTAAGGLTADTLFNAWMNAYDDAQIKSIIEIHWLTLDDDDGNIDNGTPNYTHIDGGFTDQGFPGFPLPFVAFADVTELPDTTDEVGPYPVEARITAQFNPPLSTPTLRWRVNDGGWTDVPMAPLGGDRYGAVIPGQASPAKVEYYLSGSDALGNTGSYPTAGASAPLRFLIGVQTVFFSEDFESGAAGWTHGQISTQDDWQRSADVGLVGAGGKSGDPTSAFSGVNIWGNDLGPDGWNGAYTDNVHNWLRSPPIDLSGAVGTRLRFQRWLTIESGLYDHARVLVDGVEVWSNPTSGDLLDSGWVETEVDIAGVADGKSDVRLEFRLESDASVVFGGWNIDDVEILSLQAGCTAPTATDPVDQGVCPGSGVAFSTTASGTSPMTYQWKKDGAPIGGATASTYSIASVAPGDAGAYSVEVTNSCGAVETAAAVLTVNSPPTASAPAGATVCAGSPASFSTTAGGTGPFSYQWKKDGAPIPGASASTWSLPAVSAGDAGAYSCEVTGACGTVESSAAVLVVNEPVTAAPPAGTTACPGDLVSFSTTAGGTGPFQYQWRKDGAAIGGATASTYSIASVSSGDAGSYTVVVTGACGWLETSPAVLLVNEAATASDPDGLTVCEGSPASFATTAGGTGPFQYQWKKDGAPIGGATTATWSIPSVTPADAGLYSVEVTGACGTVETAAAELVVSSPVDATAPDDVDVCVGGPASFATTASGSGPFTYQWKKDGAPIAGANDATYSIAAVSAGDAGGYSVEVTGACGAVETPAATLTVSGVTTVYCTAKVNSQGCLPAIAAAGVPSASAGSGYVISADQVRATSSGVFFYSSTGPAAIPFQGGFLCVAGQVRRTAGQNSGGSGPCGGQFALDFNAYIATGADVALVPGVQFWGQYWSRDPQSPSGTSLTDAVTAVICN